VYARSLSCSQYWQRAFGPGRGLLRILIGGDTPRMSGRSANEGGVVWHFHIRGSKPVNLATLAA